jgi:hypothetical protein
MSTGQLAFKAPMRTQTVPDRICTLGAIIQLFSVSFRAHLHVPQFSLFLCRQEMGCDPLVLQSLSELLMLKAHVICSGKGFKSNLEHPESSSPALQLHHAPSHDVGRLCLSPSFCPSLLLLFAAFHP